MEPCTERLQQQRYTQSRRPGFAPDFTGHLKRSEPHKYCTSSFVQRAAPSAKPTSNVIEKPGSL
jgi:hypothetical protein